MKDENLVKILEDKEFLKKVINSADIHYVKLLFSEKGIVLSEDDINKIGIMVKDSLSHPDKEFYDVVGGVDVTKKIKNIAYAISAVCIAGSIVCTSYKLNQTIDTVSGKIDDVEPTWLGKFFLKFDKKK